LRSLVMKLARTPRGVAMVIFAFSGLYTVYNSGKVGVGKKAAIDSRAAAKEVQRELRAFHASPKA